MIHRLGGTDRPHVSGVAGDVCQRGRGATGFGPFGLTMQGACGITGATMRFATLAPPNVAFHVRYTPASAAKADMTEVPRWATAVVRPTAAALV